jgi:peroxiredoxin
MVFLVTAVVLVGVLGLLNLLLTTGVIRRLREHTELLSKRPEGGGPDLMARPGTTVGAFAATTVEGEAVSRDTLLDGTLVGFFTPNCKPCAEQLPRFVAAARELPHGYRQVLAVVVGPPEQTADYAAQLRSVAQVVLEDGHGEVREAFKVRGYPAVCTVDGNGVIVRNGLPGALAVPTG